MNPQAGNFFDRLFQTATPVPPTGIDQTANVELFVGCILIVIATLFYAVGFKWWQRRAGRAIISVLASISLLLLHLTISRFAGGDYLFRDLVRAAVYLALPVSVLYLIYTLVRSFFGGPEEAIRVDTVRRLVTGPNRIIQPDDPEQRSHRPKGPTADR